MPKQRLTEEFIAELRPPERSKVDYFDAGMPGLILRNNYGGRMTWCVLHYVKGTDGNGKPKTIPTTKKIGKWPNITLKEARQLAKRFDPHQAEKDARDRQASRTFEDVARAWLVEHVEGQGLRSGKEMVRHLTRYVFPQWNGRAIRDLRRIDVKDLERHISVNHGQTQSEAVLRTVRSLMTWYGEEDEEFRIPFAPRRRSHRQIEDRARSRYLDDEEIRQLWKVCEQCGMYGALTKLLLLTGQRLRKVAHLQWDDLDSNGVWTIRTERREKGHAGKIKLPALALELIRGLPRVDGNPHVFPAVRGSGPMNSFQELKQALDQKLPPNMPAWVLHDLRRTARSLLARERLRVPDHIAERLLGHQLQGVQRVYNRHPYFEEKSEALAKLADEITRIVSPPEGNVVTLPRRGRRARSGRSG
jgi:integrase